MFSGTRKFRCGEKLARLCDGVGRRRFSAESVSFCERTVTEVSRWLAVSFCWCCAIVFATRSLQPLWQVRKPTWRRAQSLRAAGSACRTVQLAGAEEVKGQMCSSHIRKGLAAWRHPLSYIPPNSQKQSASWGFGIDSNLKAWSLYPCFLAALQFRKLSESGLSSKVYW